MKLGRVVGGSLLLLIAIYFTIIEIVRLTESPEPQCPPHASCLEFPQSHSISYSNLVIIAATSALGTVLIINGIEKKPAIPA